MAELAYNEAMLELSLNPDFAKLSKEQQQQDKALRYIAKPSDETP